MSSNPLNKAFKKEDGSDTKFTAFLKKIGNFLKKVYEKPAFKSILSSVISILIGLLVGFIVMIIISSINKEGHISDAYYGLKTLCKGPFASRIPKNVIAYIGNMIFYSAPLIMTGLSVGIAYKTGLFNIGAPGQYLMGTVGSLLISLSIVTTNRFGGVMVWLLAIIVGMIFAMIWGIIPGLLKAMFNINEVIICIMTNWIAANLATWIFKNCPNLWSTEDTKLTYLGKPVLNYTPKFGLDKIFPNSYIDGGIIIAIIIAIIIYIILNKTTFGYELKACGSNRNAAKYAGLNEKKNIIISMAIAGALAGLGGCLYYLNPGIEYCYASQYSKLPDYGFNGIASAFLANCNPIGIIFSSIFIRYINIGGDFLNKYNYNRYVADIIIGVIIYLAGFTSLIRGLLNKKRRPKPNKNITNVNTNDVTKEAKSE